MFTSKKHSRKQDADEHVTDYSYPHHKLYECKAYSRLCCLAVTKKDKIVKNQDISLLPVSQSPVALTGRE